MLLDFILVFALLQLCVFVFNSWAKKIQCTIFGGDKEVLKDTLKVFHTYSITNINTIPGDYRVIDNELQWSLSARTLIEGISVPTLTVRSLKYKFVPLIKLEDYCKDTQGFDVLFAGINVDPKRPANDAFVLHVTAIDQGFQTFNQRIVHFHLQSANA